MVERRLASARDEDLVAATEIGIVLQVTVVEVKIRKRLRNTTAQIIEG